MVNGINLLLMMYYAPLRALSVIRDSASFGSAALIALASEVAYLTYTRWPYIELLFTQRPERAILSLVVESAQVLLFISVILVPCIIFFANIFDRRNQFRFVLQQEYSSTAAMVLYSWASASLIALPLLVAARASGMESEVVRMSLEQAYQMVGREKLPANYAEMLSWSFSFLIRMSLFIWWLVVAIREAFRITWPRTLGVVLSATSFVILIAPTVQILFSFVFGSPLLIIILFFLLRGYFGEVATNQRARASFKKNLEAATLNPADASAHYNLGLIHLQRNELAEARKRFEKAIEIDIEEIDAHYQLGRISRAESNLPDAIKHFEQVVVRDPNHAQQEIWREIGATYLAAKQFEDARDALEKFMERRQQDPQALYLMGRVYAGMGHRGRAVELMNACIEAVKSSPAYKYRAEKTWLKEAQQFLRSQA
jgi:tetratricopeptide (TPR) repeat protein